MSTELGDQFGAEHHEKYSEVLEAWANSVTGDKISDKMVEKWGADLHDALAEDIITSLTSKDSISPWLKADLKLPSKETLERYSQIAAKYSLQYATRDLLDRLIKSADFNKENPVEDSVTDDTVTASFYSGNLVAAGIKMRPSELAKRSPQTVAQIFDMAKDKFVSIISNRLTKEVQLTGERRWVTDGENSRHAELHHEIKKPGEFFSYNKEKIAAPRPVGGAPESWSNCSCTTQYRTKKGSWVSF